MPSTSIQVSIRRVTMAHDSGYEYHRLSVPSRMLGSGKDKQTAGDGRLYSYNEYSPLSTYSRLNQVLRHFSNPLPSSMSSSGLLSTPPLTPPRIATRGSPGVEPIATRSPSAGPATNALAKGSRHSAIHTRAMASREFVYSPLRRLRARGTMLWRWCWRGVTANSE